MAIIDNERLKTVAASIAGPLADRSKLRQHLFAQLAAEIVAKLDQFGKLSEQSAEDGSIVLTSYITIIVPQNQ